MHNRAGTPFHHLRSQEAIKADRGHKVQVQFGKPVIVRQGEKAAARRGRAADHVGEDVDAAHTLERRLGQGLPAFGRRQIRPDELDAVDGLQGSAGCGDHPGAPGQEAVDGGAAQTLAAAADEHTLSSELRGINFDVHVVISSALMASFSSVKR